MLYRCTGDISIYPSSLSPHLKKQQSSSDTVLLLNTNARLVVCQASDCIGKTCRFCKNCGSQVHRALSAEPEPLRAKDSSVIKISFRPVDKDTRQFQLFLFAAGHHGTCPQLKHRLPGDGPIYRLGQREEQKVWILSQDHPINRYLEWSTARKVMGKIAAYLHQEMKDFYGLLFLVLNRNFEFLLQLAVDVGEPPRCMPASILFKIPSQDAERQVESINQFLAERGLAKVNCISTT